VCERVRERDRPFVGSPWAGQGVVCMCVCVREARGRCVYVLCVGEALVLARLVQGAAKKQVCVCCFYV